MILSTDFRKQFNFRERCFLSCHERDKTHVMYDTRPFILLDSVMFISRIRKMVSFEFGKEREKDVIHEFLNGSRSL